MCYLGQTRPTARIYGRNHMILKGVTASAAALSLAGCGVLGPPPKPQPSGHLDNTAQAAPAPAPAIPAVIPTAPVVPPPAAAAADERYTVVVNEVPVRELLFALARDAKLNIDIGGEIAGPVTLNAVDQTLPQILERIARQVDLSYKIVGDTIRVAPDEPYLHTYEVGYVNLARDVDTTVNVATRVATTGETSVEDNSSSGGSGGGDDNNASSTRLQSRSYNRFWDTLRVGADRKLSHFLG